MTTPGGSNRSAPVELDIEALRNIVAAHGDAQRQPDNEAAAQMVIAALHVEALDAAVTKAEVETKTEIQAKAGAGVEDRANGRAQGPESGGPAKAEADGTDGRPPVEGPVETPLAGSPPVRTAPSTPIDLEGVVDVATPAGGKAGAPGDHAGRSGDTPAPAGTAEGVAAVASPLPEVVAAHVVTQAVAEGSVNQVDPQAKAKADAETDARLEALGAEGLAEIDAQLDALQSPFLAGLVEEAEGRRIDFVRLFGSAEAMQNALIDAFGRHSALTNADPANMEADFDRFARSLLFQIWSNWMTSSVPQNLELTLRGPDGKPLQGTDGKPVIYGYLKAQDGNAAYHEGPLPKVSDSPSAQTQASLKKAVSLAQGAFRGFTMSSGPADFERMVRDQMAWKNVSVDPSRGAWTIPLLAAREGQDRVFGYLTMDADGVVKFYATDFLSALISKFDPLGRGHGYDSSIKIAQTLEKAFDAYHKVPGNQSQERIVEFLRDIHEDLDRICADLKDAKHAYLYVGNKIVGHIESVNNGYMIYKDGEHIPRLTLTDGKADNSLKIAVEKAWQEQARLQKAAASGDSLPTLQQLDDLVRRDLGVAKVAGVADWRLPLYSDKDQLFGFLFFSDGVVKFFPTDLKTRIAAIFNQPDVEKQQRSLDALHYMADHYPNKLKVGGSEEHAGRIKFLNEKLDEISQLRQQHGSKWHIMPKNHLVFWESNGEIRADPVHSFTVQDPNSQAALKKALERAMRVHTFVEGGNYNPYVKGSTENGKYVHSQWQIDHDRAKFGADILRKAYVQQMISPNNWSVPLMMTPKGGGPEFEYGRLVSKNGYPFFEMGKDLRQYHATLSHKIWSGQHWGMFEIRVKEGRSDDGGFMGR